MKHIKDISRLKLGLTILLLSVGDAAHAVGSEFVGVPLLDDILSTIIYSSIGICMALVAYRGIDVLTPGDLSGDIARNQNTALAILAGSIMIGVCIIIGAVLIG